MADSMAVRVEVDQQSLRLLVSALRKEADGKQLGQDMARNLKTVAEPALQAARAAILGMPSSTETAPGLRATVASQTRISVRRSGKRPGVAIRASKRGMPRKFRNAPQRLNRKQGWRHPVFGGAWVTQIGQPGWFDDTIAAFKPAAVIAAGLVLDEMKARIAARTR